MTDKKFIITIVIALLGLSLTIIGFWPIDDIARWTGVALGWFKLIGVAVVALGLIVASLLYWKGEHVGGEPWKPDPQTDEALYAWLVLVLGETEMFVTDLYEQLNTEDEMTHESQQIHCSYIKSFLRYRGLESSPQITQRLKTNEEKRHLDDRKLILTALRRIQKTLAKRPFRSPLVSISIARTQAKNLLETTMNEARGRVVSVFKPKISRRLAGNRTKGSKK